MNSDHVSKSRYLVFPTSHKNLQNRKNTLYKQIDFLQRFFESKLLIKERTEKLMKALMVIEENENFKLSGKTGWSISGEENNGWFVGYVETKGNLYYFSTNVEPSDNFNMEQFPAIRKTVTMQALKQMSILP